MNLYVKNLRILRSYKLRSIFLFLLHTEMQFDNNLVVNEQQSIGDSSFNEQEQIKQSSYLEKHLLFLDSAHESIRFAVV